MGTPSGALFIAIPTAIFSFCSFWAALYISASCWLMKKLHHRRFDTDTTNHPFKPLPGVPSNAASMKTSSRSTYSSRDYSDMTPNTPNAPNAPNAHKSSHKSSHKSTDPISAFIYKKYSTTSDQYVSAFVEEHNISASWERPQLIMHHIFYMSLCDVLLSFCLFLNYITQIFVGSKHSLFAIGGYNAICYISGIILQFALVGTVVWYFVVGCNLFRIVFGLNNTNFDKIKRDDAIFAWIVIILCSIIPIFTNNYGEINNLSSIDYPSFNDKHCWISNEIYRLCLYIPVLITILFTTFLLFSVILKWYKDNETDRCRLCNICCLKTDYIFGGISLPDSAIVSRLTAFSLVFLSIWITPAINEFIQIVTQKQTKIFFTAISQWSIALIGCANCFIWSRSKNFRSFVNSYHGIVDIGHTKRNSIFETYDNELNI